MEKLPEEAYIALEALKNHGWSLLVQTTVPGDMASSFDETLTEAEAQMHASEPWTSLILDEWAKGNGNRTEADKEWLESVFGASGSRNPDTFDSGDW